MNQKIILGLSSALCLGAGALTAQEANEVEALKRRLQQATEQFQKSIEEQRKVIEELNRRIDAMGRKAGAASGHHEHAAAPVATNGATLSLSPGLVRGQSQQGAAYLDIGLVGNVAVGGSTARDIEEGTQLGGHDPSGRGFTLQGLEASFTGAVDPYFRGNANLAFGINAGNESFLEVEEAWLETVSLPGNLSLRAGQIWTEFGRHNATHLHTWSFVDAPLVNARLLGPDGLRNPGARVSWLAPTPFYSEFILGVQNSSGETATGFRSGGHSHGGEESDEALPFGYRHPDNDRGLRSMGDMLFSARYAASVDLTGNQVLLGGVSAALGPNARGGEGAGATDTEVFGADLTWKWKSPNHNAGFPFVLWQTEALLQRYEAGRFDWDENGNAAADDGELINTGTGLPAVLRGETLIDYGFYSQVLYGFRKGWVAGLRFDYVTGDRAEYERLNLTFNGDSVGRDPARAQRWRLSPNLTWYPTEFSKVRLQYNFDDRRVEGVDHSVWLQFEFLLGAHAAHKF